MKHPPVHYHDYLKLNQLLDSQKRRSEELGAPAHDEMLFITVHQAYELWFKQIIFELNSVLEIFGQNPMPEAALNLVEHRLDRVLGILRLSLGHIDIMETMTPLDFLDFRDYLYPASGFQSVQFRMIETKLGLRQDDRLLYNQSPFWKSLPEAHQKDVLAALSQKSLFELVESWLERTPFLQADGFDFWNSYKQAVLDMLAQDRKTAEGNPRLGPDELKRTLAMIDGSRDTFNALFDKDGFEKLREQGQFRLSQRAVQAALFIQVYREEPILQLPFRVLSRLLDLDEVLTAWRARHAQMALRMLGRKIGTGGSSGHQYLKDASDKHKIFTDFFALATFLIPRSKVPALPPELHKRMGYRGETV